MVHRVEIKSSFVDFRDIEDAEQFEELAVVASEHDAHVFVYRHKLTNKIIVEVRDAHDLILRGGGFWGPKNRPKQHAIRSLEGKSASADVEIVFSSRDVKNLRVQVNS